MTPREVDIVLRTKAETEREEHEERIRLALFSAWHVAALSRTRRLPSFKSIIGRGAAPKRKPARRQTPTEHEQMIRLLAQTMGGRIKPNKPAEVEGSDNG